MFDVATEFTRRFCRPIWPNLAGNDRTAWTLRVGICVAVMSLPLHVGSARAANVAERDVIGFSQDARYFAFEVFGRQDGSGFPFSEITIIDLLSDAWAGGSPFRVVLEDETRSVEDARSQIRSDAASAINALGATAAYALLASNPPTELSANQSEVSFRPRAVLSDIDAPRTLVLETFTLPAAEVCAPFGDMKGFALTVTIDGQATEVYRDDTIPGSRNCPLDYGISDVIIPFEGDTWRAVVLMSVFQVGFEGPDRRFLAVPLPLEEK